MDFSRVPGWAWGGAVFAVALSAGFVIGRNNATSSGETGRPDREGLAAAGWLRPERAGPGMSGGATRVVRGKSQRPSWPDAGDLSGDLEHHLQFILDSDSRLERAQRLLSFLDRLPDDRFADVYARLSEPPGAQVRGAERSLVLQAWVERNPLEALGHLQEHGAEDWERETAVGAWATMNPQAAFEWAVEAPDEGRVNNWLVGAIRGIASMSPELGKDFLLQIEPGDTRSRSLRSIQPYVMQYGFDYATEWIAGIGEADLQSEASRRLADNLAEMDPVRAGEWNAALGERETRRDVSEIVSDRWARQDLEGAMQWVESLPEDTRTEAAEGVARHYARADPAEAAAWLAGLGDNPDLDGAKRIFISEAYERDPAVSLDFISQLANERSQIGYYHRYLRSWMRQDAAAARVWAENNRDALPQSLVNRYLR